MLVSCRLLRSRPPFRRDLLESAQKYGIGGTQKVEGDVSLGSLSRMRQRVRKLTCSGTVGCSKRQKWIGEIRCRQVIRAGTERANILFLYPDIRLAFLAE
jgi:hypothetical protein